MTEESSSVQQQQQRKKCHPRVNTRLVLENKNKKVKFFVKK